MKNPLGKHPPYERILGPKTRTYGGCETNGCVTFWAPKARSAVTENPPPLEEAPFLLLTAGRALRAPRIKQELGLHPPYARVLGIRGHECNDPVFCLFRKVCRSTKHSVQTVCVYLGPYHVLEEFAGGARRQSLLELYELCCKLALVPITERCIEAPHGAIKLNCAFKHAGPLCVSASIRLPELDRDLRSAEDWERMAACVEETKHMRAVPHLLGINGHHWLRGLPPNLQGVQTHRLLALLTQIIYRCDCSSQFEDWGAFKKHNESAKRKRKAEGLKRAPQQTAKLDFDVLLSRLATDHFRDAASPNEIHSIPANTLGVSIAPLKQLLSRPVIPKPSMSASADMVLDTDMDESFDCTLGDPGHCLGKSTYRVNLECKTVNHLCSLKFVRCNTHRIAPGPDLHGLPRPMPSTYFRQLS